MQSKVTEEKSKATLKAASEITLETISRYDWEKRLYEAAKSLETWYQSSHRDLPWRYNINAYRVWISEIMLQQTRSETVKPYYHRFLSAFPDINHLASAPDDELLKLWEGLGYYSRARNLKKTAIICREQFGGTLPANYKELLSLPGIGSYTAGAIASIAYGLPYPAVDGNVLRVINRILADESDITKPQTKKNMENMLTIFIDEYLKYEPGIFNQALMELGACVCIPNGKPLCGSCPVAHVCLARIEDRTEFIPFKSKKKPRKKEWRTIFVLADEGGIILHKRPQSGLLAGLWELPSVDGTFTREETVHFWQNLINEPVEAEKLPQGKHIFSHIEWHMSAWQIKTSKPLCFYKNRIEEASYLLASKEDLKKITIPSAFEIWSGFWKEGFID